MCSKLTILSCFSIPVYRECVADLPATLERGVVLSTDPYHRSCGRRNLKKIGELKSLYTAKNHSNYTSMCNKKDLFVPVFLQ